MNGIGVDIVDLNRFDLKNERFIKHILCRNICTKNSSKNAYRNNKIYESLS